MALGGAPPAPSPPAPTAPAQTGPLPPQLPHWTLELLAIGIGLVALVFGHSQVVQDLGSALGGAGVTGMVHDLAS